MPSYTAITFAPVQGFIEKSRKLRDLFGASLILSYLSSKIVEKAHRTPGVEVISPGLMNCQKGMPNRILLKGIFSQDEVRNILLYEWKFLLKECRVWVEDQLRDYTYSWERDWNNWGNHAWEIFWGTGETIEEAMQDLETCKLSRRWTAINWIGESSSLTGTDAIAWYGLGAEDRNPKHRKWQNEKDDIEKFYQQLSCILENKSSDAKPEGKFLVPNEKLSIPELAKRLVTREDIARNIGMPTLKAGFTDIVRKPTGQWTGWFMGDGDKVGDKLKEIAKEQKDEEIKKFSEAMRNWGRDFEKKFDADEIGRIIYAGGDDFLGVIYNSDNPSEQIKPCIALEWLMRLPQEWEKHGQSITLSVGFVWVAGSVPQRDILQHCREAEKLAKKLGRNRVTIRVVFNSGQYVQWTCPWADLHILQKYRDRNGKTWGQQPNWSHIYTNFAQLKARHAFGFTKDDQSINSKEMQNEIRENCNAALEFLEIYFKGMKEYLKQNENQKRIVGYAGDAPQREKAMIHWICDLINVSWYLCSDTL